jgi:hypothetical protein
LESFYGNSDVVDTLEQMIRGDRITQTLLLSGPEASARLRWPGVSPRRCLAIRKKSSRTI